METPEGPKIIQALMGPRTYDGRTHNKTAQTPSGQAMGASRLAGNRSFSPPQSIALHNSMSISR
jgi:hypothetical protein